MSRKKKMIGGKHLQHSGKFIKECNSVLVKYFDAFRTFDEIWKIGKYKGIKLKDTPTSYINWAYSTMKLSKNSKSILRKYLPSNESNN